MLLQLLISRAYSARWRVSTAKVVVRHSKAMLVMFGALVLLTPCAAGHRIGITNGKNQADKDVEGLTRRPLSVPRRKEDHEGDAEINGAKAGNGGNAPEIREEGTSTTRRVDPETEHRVQSPRADTVEKEALFSGMSFVRVDFTEEYFGHVEILAKLQTCSHFCFINF